MASISREELALIVADKTALYRATPGDAPPPQLVEALIELESESDGATFRTDLVDASSNAQGLGQIIVGRADWGYAAADPIFKQQYGTPEASRLLDPEYNVAMVVSALNARQELGIAKQGAYRDWYMAAAGYFGGADNDGFIAGADDVYDTTGPSYLRGVFDRVTDKWGIELAVGIDALQPGTGVSGVYNPDAQYAGEESDPSSPYPQIADTYYTAAQIYDMERYTGGKRRDMPTYAGTGWLDTLFGTLGGWASRVGLFLAGVILLGGAVVLSKRG
jgi:hypothetical protein